MQNLKWRIDRPGYYFTDTVGNVEFSATIRRETPGVWSLMTYVCALPLHMSEHRTLAAARDDANLTFRTVEV